LGFLNSEIGRLQRSIQPVEQLCGIIDTLVMARQRHPGQKNNLDALCQRYGVDNSQRDLHGALLDAEILADVYLLMTGGQTALELAATEAEDRSSAGGGTGVRRLDPQRSPLRVVRAVTLELEAHEQRLASIDKTSGGNTVWRR
jgi:DNA polymerase-3 subunit epsilon